MKQKIVTTVLIIIMLILIGILAYILALNSISRNIEKNQESVELTGELKQDEQEEEKAEENDELIVQEYTASDGNQYEVIAVLNIPSLEIEYPVLSSTSKELLKISLNKYWGPNPNRVGNFCIVGHNYNDSRFFGKLNKIQKNDVIQLTDMGGKTVNYLVYDTYTVNPDNTKCTSQLTNGKKEITLITCTASGKQRFIVKAIEERDKLK